MGWIARKAGSRTGRQAGIVIAVIIIIIDTPLDTVGKGREGTWKWRSGMGFSLSKNRCMLMCEYILVSSPPLRIVMKKQNMDRGS